LNYSAAGLSVFPLNVRIDDDGRKIVKPIPNWDEQSTSNQARIHHWFGPHGAYRTASLAIDTGKSDLVVIDPDGELGIANWAALQTQHNVGNTYRARTPGGGQHWYYRADPERPVKNTESKLAPKVDTRGTGGFVIAPPSADARGTYHWMEGAPDWTALPVIPTAVVALVAVPRLRQVPSGGITRGPTNSKRRFTQDQAVAFCRPFMVELEQAVEGTRNGRLNAAAKVLSHFCPDFWTWETAVKLLHRALDPTYPKDEAEATIRSAFDSAANDWVAEKITKPTHLEEVIPPPEEPTDFPPEEAGSPPARVELPGLPLEFWEARPILRHIKQAAYARGQVPDVVLHTILARIAALRDYRIVADSGISEPASLNYFVGIVGQSGDGKSQGTKVGTKLIYPPVDLDFEGNLPIGSGEGLAEAYMGTVTVKDDLNPNSEGKEVRKQARHNAYFWVDEGASLTTLLSRKGYTIGPTLRTAWEGSTIGQQNAGENTKRVIHGGTYALGFVIGLQPSIVTELLAGVDTGTPQRFVWSTAQDRDFPTDRIDWPGPLTEAGFDPNILLFPKELCDAFGDPQGQCVMTFPEVIKEELWVEYTGRRRGLVADFGLYDGQKPLTLVKVAALLAMLDSRRDVAVEDWELAQCIWETSCRIRDILLQSTAAEKQRTQELRDANRIEHRVHEELAVGAIPSKVSRLAKLVAKWVRSSTEPLNRNDMRKHRVTSRDRDYLDAAIEAALTEGWITTEPDGAYSPAAGAQAA